MAKQATGSKSITQYKKENYDRINVDLPKGEREIIKEHVDKMGISMQAFIREAIYAAVNQDRERMVNPPPAYVPREITKEDIEEMRPHVPKGYSDRQIKETILEFDKIEYDMQYNQKRPTKLRSYKDWLFEFSTGEDIDVLRAERDAERAAAEEAAAYEAQRDMEYEEMLAQKEAAFEAQQDMEYEAMLAEQDAAYEAQKDMEYDALQADKDAALEFKQEMEKMVWDETQNSRRPKKS